MSDKSKSKLKKIEQECVNNHTGDNYAIRMCIIDDEFERGFEAIRRYPKSVTIFGSARLDENSKYSKQATELARRIAEEGYAITTGGGHGIMGAAHKGAYLANGQSLGINIELSHEQTMNKYITDYVEFHHFFSRKVILTYSAEVFIYFPGGFGTMDELFEILTLKQNNKIPNIPVILFGSKFWNPFKKFIEKNLLKNSTISRRDLDLFIITDDIDRAVKIVKYAKIRTDIEPDLKEFGYDKNI